MLVTNIVMRGGCFLHDSSNLVRCTDRRRVVAACIEYCILLCVLRSCALQPQIEEGAVLVEEKVWQYHCRLFYSSDLHYV